MQDGRPWLTRLAAALLALVVLHLAARRICAKSRTRLVDPSEERVVLLGASTLDGLGAAFLKQYLERGTRRIMIVGRRKAALEEVRAAMLEVTKGRRHPDAEVEVFVAQLTSPADVLRLRDVLLQKWQGLDTLHIVFGVTSILPILGVADVDPCNVNASGDKTTRVHPTQAGLEQLCDTVQHSSDGNLKGTAIVLAAMIPVLQTRSESPAVIGIGSVAGLVPAPTRAIYCATKSSQHYLLRSVELECDSQAGTFVPGTAQRRAHVRFLLVAPGPIKNSFVAKYAVDSATGPRDNRDKALEVHDVVRHTLQRVDAQAWGMLVLPRVAFVASLLAQFDSTYVSATYTDAP